MPADIIKTYLLRDVVDSTAAAIRALNPGVWDSDDQVPVYLYTSLCTLWTGSSGDVVSFNRRVISHSGEGKARPEMISISPYLCESADDSQGPEFLDLQGAENAIVYIYFGVKKNPTTDAELSRTSDAELRVRCLLDANLRGLSRKNQNLPISGDNSINAGEGIFLMSWKGLLNDPNAIEQVAEYKSSYVRQFGKSIIP